MKRILLVLSAVLSVALGAVDTGLLKMIPAKYDAAVLTDVSKLLKLPALKSVLEDEDVAGATAQLEQSGVKLSDIKEILVFVCGDNVGTVVKVSNGAKIREMFDASPNQDDFSVEAMQLNGRRIYRFTTKGKSERPVCLFISDELILGSDSVEHLEAFLAAPKLSAEEAKKLASGIPSKVTFWGVWSNPEPAPKPDEKGAAERIDRVMGTIDFTGKEMRDLDITAEILCGNENFAATLGMMIPGYISIGSGVVFADAPELGEELIKGFKAQPKGRTLKLSLYMSEKLVRHITDFSTRTAKSQISAKPEPATATPGAPAADEPKAPAADKPKAPAAQ